MNKFKKYQVLLFFVLILFLAITPLLPSSLRPTCLYLISNLIVIALSAEAGIFSLSYQKPMIPSEASSQKSEPSIPSEHVEKKLKFAVEKSESERFVSAIKVQKEPSSKASLFFIGNGEADEGIMDEETEAEEEEMEGVNRQELFAKAEVFIGNFYKQLKMQREDPWIYQKAF